MRQTGRGDDHVGGHFLAPEHVKLTRLHIGRRHEQFQVFAGTHRIEVDKSSDQILQRIDVERIEIVGGEISRERLHPQAYRRILDRPERKQPVYGAALKVREISGKASRLPEIGEPLARLVGAAARETVGQHDRIDGTGRCAGNAFDRQPAVFEQMVEHTPGECAERAAALQGEIDAFAGFWLFGFVAAEGAREKLNHCLGVTARPNRHRSNRPIR